MRILGKLLFKLLTFAVMVIVMSSGVRYGQRYFSKSSSVPQLEGGLTTNEESDLMSTVFKSALRLFSGEAKREDLAAELSDKLYAGRASASDMEELGIELVKPGSGSPLPLPAPGTVVPGASAQPGVPAAKPLPGAPVTAGAVVAANTPAAAAKLPVKPGTVPAANPKTQPAAAPVAAAAKNSQEALRQRVWEQTKRYSVELGMVPVALLGMYLMHRMRRRRSKADDFVPAHMSIQVPSDSEPYDMKNPVHSMKVEDFELLVALIYQRQGYRVSMPAALGGGRGIDFTLARRSERILVQCKRLNQDQRIPIEKVRELHDAVTTAGATRGIYVASCGFTWDARNFAKAKGLQVINARTLDELITAAREQPDENLTDVAAWVPKFLSKVEITTPLCPACEAPMEQINATSEGSVWVCSQRPECKGRRAGRKHQKPVKPAQPTADSATAAA